MARRGGDLEAFTAFCAGVTSAFLGWLVVHGLAALGALPQRLHGPLLLLVAAAGAGCAVAVYRTLRAPEAAQLVQDLESLRELKDRQDSKSRAASSS
ncbi:hypothetical protein GCM10010193_43130 [Kitasatospora atroaurantiaca]|uniref:Uncharacterized protein n=1 Tax=Kitasatospora atroaurantiaca TaxID=285545 RepID=A0A561ETS6_9ACTN|nr:hypothetical protein [Kitasatospora atroaurantiaca]TWE19018.1 hypothetical protein FB465_4119 [Kitasatospora atroaurantiaca]